ncbi:MAG TPA: DUF3857 domain-containing protein [Candidatus Aquilonibacter sp.]|nr:DUF3857 domain-containing protein [Candidatus Aquilonibacter sp.]
MISALRPQSLNRTLGALALSAAILAPLAVRAQNGSFIEPTKDELSMTSLPGYPGVAAVVLNEEVITKDDLHSATHYERIKILTEDGKKYANVELPYVTTSDIYDAGGANDKTLDTIQGRTIHPDGTVIPFTGKPYLKVIEKARDVKVQEKVFTLPDVTVGSIIEYRYASRINDYVYEPPTWIIQGDLYVKSAHYVWYPTSHPLQNAHGVINSISWFPILPQGAEIKHTETPGIGALGNSQYIYELNIKDVPPFPEEEFMPPITNYGYRVYWNFIAEHNGDDFWKTEGKDWSHKVNSFANPNGDLKSAAQQITAGTTTQDQKLRAIYAAVMTLENTDFTRSHEQREDKANGLGKVSNAADVFKHERGDSFQLTALFIGLARAAGMQADAMLVPDRSRELFLPQWLSFSQFDDTIAIVNVDGKDMFFDPGERYCPYGHLAWQHTFVKGLRQKGNETEFADTPGDGFRANEIDRVANLNMDASGQITGKIDLAYNGAQALRWRHAALRGDEDSLKHELRVSLENLIPHSLEVKEVTVSNLTDYEKPLLVSYTVAGTAGTWTGKRLVLPADLFTARERATFPHEKRDIAVDFHYPARTLDALRINFPSTFTVEAAPSVSKLAMEHLAAYGMSVVAAPANFTTRREYDFGEVFVLPSEYSQLRTFYSQFEANDQQSIVLKSTAAPAVAAMTAAADGAAHAQN